MKLIFTLFLVLCYRSLCFITSIQRDGLKLRPYSKGISSLSRIISSEKTILAHVNLNELDDLVKGDKIFKLHSVGAAFFGGASFWRQI